MELHAAFLLREEAVIMKKWKKEELGK